MSARRFPGVALISVLATTALLLPAAPAVGGSGVEDPMPLPAPESDGRLGLVDADAPLLKGSGPVDVSVRLSEPAIAEILPPGALARHELPSAATQRARLALVRRQQTGVSHAARALGAEVTGHVTRVLNALTMRVDAALLHEVAGLPGVVSVTRFGRYQTLSNDSGSGSLTQAVTYLGAASVHQQGIDGTGVRVAVLDSGIDFTHHNLGGPGTVADYTSCYTGAGAAYDSTPAGPCAGLFGPTAPKVKGGYDFVGEAWTGSDGGPVEVPDPNPIDAQGHGTHVADIAAGRSADGLHIGIAPGASVYAVKVCSAVSTACSGPAILQGIDWTLDPDGDGDVSDAMDVVNLSLGASYGVPEDDSTFALDNAVRAGVMAISSAGNSGDIPFVVGSPSSAPRVVSVAQTTLPDEALYPIVVLTPQIPALPNNTVRYSILQTWSPTPTSAVVAPMARPAVNALGCNLSDFAGFPAGWVALVLRGTCAVSVKASNASAAGASSVVVYNNAAGIPPSFSYGGGTVTVPTYVIPQADGVALVNALGAGQVVVSIDPSAPLSLAHTMVGSSSRGPRQVDEVTKPDIGAPGAWLSAQVGTGDADTAFGGTSGAAPVVTGVAALVLQSHPDATPEEVKARLLNAGDGAIATLDEQAFPDPAPVSRVGTGQVRADAAVDAVGVLRNLQEGAGNLGLGLPHVSEATRTVLGFSLRNTGPTGRRYTLAASFRDRADEALGAIKITLPPSVWVPAHSAVRIDMTVTVDPRRLPRWPLAGVAGQTASGTALDGPELDGTLTATSGPETLRLGWQVLPHRSADVGAPPTVDIGQDGTGTLTLTNGSAVLDGTVNVYGLTGTSPRLPDPAPGGPGSPGSQAFIIDLAAVGVRNETAPVPRVTFLMAGYGRRTVPQLPAYYQVDIDTNRDGSADFSVYPYYYATLGWTTVAVYNWASPRTTLYCCVLADFDDATMAMPVPLSALGLSSPSTFDFDVTAFDGYFTGQVTDTILDQTWSTDSARYTTPEQTLTVPAGGTLATTLTRDAGAGPSTQTGLLLQYEDARHRDAGAVEAVEVALPPVGPDAVPTEEAVPATSETVAALQRVGVVLGRALDRYRRTAALWAAGRSERAAQVLVRADLLRVRGSVLLAAAERALAARDDAPVDSGLTAARRAAHDALRQVRDARHSLPRAALRG